jgi:hypothetical protein
MDLKNIDDLKPGNQNKKKKKRSAGRQREYAYSYSAYQPAVKKKSISGKPIISLLLGLGFLSAILIVTMLTAGASTHSSGNVAVKTSDGASASDGAATSGEASATTTASTTGTMPTGGGTAANTMTGQIVLGVVTAINTTTKEIALYDVEKETPVTYSYSGATNIMDKYGQPIAISQIPVGTMIDASHEPNETKLTALAISTKAWEYVGVNNLGIDRSKRVMKIASTKYKYTKDIQILNGEKFINVADLAEQDELNVWGYEETIWSITVTRGHGTVRLKDYDGFLGDFITIGYESIQQIVKDMVITVREGNFNLTVENDKYTATKNITINRDKETVVSLSDLGPEASKVGRVTFDIKPFGADLYVDGVLSSYANPVELEYGEHDLFVSLEGYTAYDGKFTVDSAGKTLRIDLPEESSKGEASVSETKTSDSKTDNGSGTGSNGQTADAGGNTGSGTSDTSGTNQGGSQTVDTGDGTSSNVSNSDFDVDAKHKIYIQNPVGASVYLNGEYMCKSPGSFEKLIGSHVLTFIKDGYQTMSYTVEVADDNLDTYFNMPDLIKK